MIFGFLWCHDPSRPVAKLPNADLNAAVDFAGIFAGGSFLTHSWSVSAYSWALSLIECLAKPKLV